MEVKSELENNMELFHNYVLLNPDGFQKIMDQIKNQQTQSGVSDNDTEAP